MSVSGKASATRPWERGRHAVSKFRRAVRVKITIEDRMRCNMEVNFKKETIRESRTDETKSLRLH